MSSDDIAIRVTNLSKCYEIYDTPRDRLKQFIIPRLLRITGKACKQYFHDFWALKDVSFEVKKGETVGIIGKNGSGKSTLLQIICGTLYPSGGTVETNGRIAALLELGSGFNPEFTGRENIFMNGTVLGLSHQEIESRLDEIVAFANIGEFIEQPTKSYSSGMVVRLAFSVIAHMSADILIIDEALSVGDFVFTQKCMRFLREFKRNGTLIFVSHDTSSVTNLCKSSIWLDKGEIHSSGAAVDVAEAYMQANLQEIYGNDIQLEAVANETHQEAEQDKIEEEPETSTTYKFFDSVADSTGWKTGTAEIISVRLTGESGNTVLTSRGGEKVCLEIKAKPSKDIYSPIIGFFMKDRLGQPLFGENTYSVSKPPLTLLEGQVAIAEFRFVLPLLPNGKYSITIAIAEGTLENHVQHNWLHDAVLLTVVTTAPRYGLMGIAFEDVSIRIQEDERQ